ncbi:DUF4157 domain-containing protein [Flavobacterium sp. J27]|uniref:eCIS core domain-containing protein n=1 Tax=Flavobacterium sp. J27 TaxID=2060419 RepID=UPI001031C02E|nr:DUF4157 domain-containing protein [Flavobacterium sp. J27]
MVLKINSIKKSIMEYAQNKTAKTQTQSIVNNFDNKTTQAKSIILQDNRPSTVLQKKANNTGLPDKLKSGIENLSGHTMDDVKVHYNSSKPAQLNAHAYAQGSEIHLASGQEKHLPHEAWHIAQQKQGRVKPTIQMKGKVNINDDEGLEKEADVMGKKAIQLKTSNTQNQNTLLPNISNTKKIVQRKITDPNEIEHIKSHYVNNQTDPIILKILIDDAIENSNNTKEAIERINRGIAHDNAMTAPVKKKSVERPKIDISEDRIRPKFISSVPHKNTNSKKLEKQWQGLNNKSFYAKTRGLLQIARDLSHTDNEKAKGELDDLINGYKQHASVKSLIDKLVRVKAKKAPGAFSGTGLDELFKTSETMKYLELSYRPPKDMHSVAKFDGKEFDWMDAQEQIRLSTEFIIWAGDLVEKISGHTGTFQNQYQQQWMTSKQALMHEVRDDAISKRSNPATAVIEAIGTHLRITENVKGYIKERYTGSEAKNVLTTDGHSIDERYKEIIADLKKHRDILKNYLDNFKKKAVPPGNSSPLISRLGGDEYHPTSPKSDTDTDNEIEMSDSGKIKDNPLYNLSTQWRKTQAEEKKTIPRKPQNKVIQEAREYIKTEWSASEATKINTAAKSKAKKALLQDPDSTNIDKIMIEVYIDRLKKLSPNKKNTPNIISNLQQEMDTLT